MKNTLPLRLRFGVFELDLKSGELHKSGKRIVLQEQPLQVLRILLENASAITTREEIQQQLWPNDTVVEFDHSINAAIKKLRVALGDSADNPKYIETIARRGYRLMVPVERMDSSAGDTPETGPASSSDEGSGVVQLEAAGLTGKTVSHYRVLEVVGGGGMGVIYKAEDLKLGRAVALKFLPEEVGNDPRALERFEREARAASSLDHPNICAIYEFGEHEGRPFIVMQLLQGQTLRDCLSSGALKDTPLAAQVSLDRLLDVAIQITDGLEAAHERGIIHRDIKPANIFITTKGVAKILDFGLAKLLQPIGEQAVAAEMQGDAGSPLAAISGRDALNLSHPGVATGTAAYMSPEQAGGEPLDARTDLFSFGLVLYEMATSQRAFTGDDAATLQEAILSRVPAPPTELNPELPAELQGIIQRCLQKDRNLRYQSAAEIRSGLQKVKRRREHPVLSRWKPLAAAAVVIVALLAGGFYWRSRKSSVLGEKQTIVLADFVNTTGDAVFDDTLKPALAIQLEQSPLLTVLSDRKVAETLKLMNRPANERLTSTVAEEVCLRNNSKSLLEGSIAPIGEHYLISLKAMNCQSGDTIASAGAEAENRNQVVKVLGEAGNQLRKKLGESPPSVEKFNTPLEEATTSSLEALEAFTQVYKMPARGNAIPLLKRALELDPNFARAYAALGVVYYNLGETRLAIENFDKAYELRNRVSPRERLQFEGYHYAFVTGQMDNALETYSQWIQTYPDDPTPHAILGVIYAEMGQYEKAAKEMQQRIRLSPEHKDYNLVGIYVCLNKLDEAQALLDQAPQQDNPLLRETRYSLAFLRGNSAAMQEQLAWAMGRPGSEDRLLAAQSNTDAYYGRLAKARQLTDGAVRSARQDDIPEAAAEWRVNEALREADIGNAVRARQSAEEALALSTGPDVELRAALALARAGDAIRAQKLVDNLNREFPLNTMMQNYWLPSIRAAVELEKNEPAKAIELLKAALPYELGSTSKIAFSGYLYPAYIRGQAYLRAGQGQQAAAEFQKLLDHPGIVRNFVLGALAHLQLGRAQALMGDKEAARKSYQDFFALWKDADPDIPILHEAKAEYGNLK